MTCFLVPSPTGYPYMQSLQPTNGVRGFFVNAGSRSGNGRSIDLNSESELRQKYQTSAAAADLSRGFRFARSDRYKVDGS
jgi:hypothetical protein